jgi:hypothetical protein
LLGAGAPGGTRQNGGDGDIKKTAVVKHGSP